ncbi:MAG: hypothetical protein Q9195_005551 [Heterodermia aff. obscurata]
MFLLPLVVLPLILTNPADAFTAYQPHCPDAPENINYASSPLVRGTLDIVWACLAVVLTCTWAVQHLSVPVHIGFRKPSWIPARIAHILKEPRLKDISFFTTKFKWMLLSIAAPEFVLGKALAERWAAQESRRQSVQEGWTSMHGFFANMRGFILRFDVEAVQTSLEASKPDELGRKLHTLRSRPAEGESPYIEQNHRRAEIFELIHCQKYCRGKDAHGDQNLESEKQSSTSPRPSQERIITNQTDNTGRQKMRLEVGSPIGLGVSHIYRESPISSSLGRRHTTDFLLASPTTAVGTPATPLYSPTLLGTPNSRLNHQEFPQPNVTTFSGTGNKILEPYTASGSNKDNQILRSHRAWRASWALNSMQIHYAMQVGIIPTSPIVRHAELKDRSKGDSFIKGFAVLQITALVIQIIARSFQGLATTLLEITVLAFAACALVTYILLWHKPQDVKEPIYVDIDKILTREQIINLAARAPVATLLIHDFWLHGVSIRAQADNIFPWTPGIRIRLPFTQDATLVSPVVLGIGGGGVLFGAVHFVAWNFTFPSPVERLLWRVSCCVLVVFPLLGTGFYCIKQHRAKTHGDEDSKVNRSLRPLMHVIGFSYLLARTYLLVEVFRALAYPEPSTFKQVNWPSAIPYMN